MFARHGLTCVWRHTQDAMAKARQMDSWNTSTSRICTFRKRSNAPAQAASAQTTHGPVTTALAP